MGVEERVNRAATEHAALCGTKKVLRFVASKTFVRKNATCLVHDPTNGAFEVPTIGKTDS